MNVIILTSLLTEVMQASSRYGRGPRVGSFWSHRYHRIMRAQAVSRKYNALGS